MRSVLSPRSTALVAACWAALAAGVCVAPASAATTTITALPSSNAIVNGDAEADAGSTDTSGATNIDSAGWDPEVGPFTVTKYGVGGFPTTAASTDIGGGVNFFSGGWADVSTAAQTVDLSALAARADGCGIGFQLDADLGGYLTHGDNAQVGLTFLDGAGLPLGTPTTLGPVTAQERGNTTKLLALQAIGTLPVGTRSVEVKLTLTRVHGSANDGYADNVALWFDHAATPVGVCEAPIPPTPVGETTTPQGAGTPNQPAPNQPALNGKRPVQLGAAKKQQLPAKKPVVKTGKPQATPTGGTAFTVTPTTTCNLTATSKFTTPGGQGARLAAGVQIIDRGRAMRVPGATVKLPAVKIPAVVPGRPVTIAVQPVTWPTAGKPVKAVTPPKAPIVTTVTCQPIKPTKLPAAFGFSAGFDLGPAAGLGVPKGGAVSSGGVKSTVKPPATNPPAPDAPPTGGGAPAGPKLTAGLWSGKLNGVVSAGPGKNAPAGVVSFDVSADGVVSNFVLEGAETCVVSAGAKQGGSVTSIPWFTTVKLSRTISFTPIDKFPRTGFAVYANTAAGTGTKSISIGSSAKAPGLTANGPTSINGQIDAVRHVAAVGTTSICSLKASFSAAPGGTAVQAVGADGYTD